MKYRNKSCEIQKQIMRAFMTAYFVLLGTTLTSDTVWRYFFKAVQRPSLLPKDSAEFRGWYDALPQTQPKESEAFQAWQKAWQKASPQMQLKKSEAFREWLQAVRENASQRSVDSHLWFKSKPPTADSTWKCHFFGGFTPGNISRRETFPSYLSRYV